jgi:hypothetical protein
VNSEGHGQKGIKVAYQGCLEAHGFQEPAGLFKQLFALLNARIEPFVVAATNNCVLSVEVLEPKFTGFQKSTPYVIISPILHNCSMWRRNPGSRGIEEEGHVVPRRSNQVVQHFRVATKQELGPDKGRERVGIANQNPIRQPFQCFLTASLGQCYLRNIRVNTPATKRQAL